MDMAPTGAHPGAAIDDVGEDRDVAGSSQMRV